QVFFIKPVPPLNAADPADPNDAYGLSTSLERIAIRGGVRIVGITAVSVARQPDGHLTLVASHAGDFSTYSLEIDTPELDPFLRRSEFSFKATCPSDFDCRQPPYCPPAARVEPQLDYMAKDFSSFRQLLFDRLPELNPAFTERNPSDLGVALLELLAYEGDHLSYYQDAVSNEATLETARQRISARRHARLVDYRMHDGRNAWTWVHFGVSAAVGLPLGSALVTKLFEPLAGTNLAPGALLDLAAISAESLEADPALAGAVVFETAHTGALDPRNNRILIHTFGNEQCCLAATTRDLYLYHVDVATGVAERPVLQAGDFLLLEEVLGPATGLAADADPLHRQVVQLDAEPEATEDPIYTNTLVNEVLQRRLAAEAPLPLLKVRIRREDRLEFPVCLSARTPHTGLVRNVSVARGNMVLADHGLTTSESLQLPGPVVGNVPFRLQVARGPLTQQCALGQVTYSDTTARITSERRTLECGVDEAEPAIALLASFPTGTELWTQVPDLLDSPPFARHFVAEVNNEGLARIRFGDGEYGREVAGATSFEVVYRIGNGPAGNVGAEAIAHLALPGSAGWLEVVRNPLAARGGTRAETVEEVRRIAPQAFRARQFRAVTEDDYARVALELPQVAGAVAEFRWTGSWYTVFVAIDPAEDSDLVHTGQGLARLAPELETAVRAVLNRYRLAGYDLEIRPPRFVPLEIDVELCVAKDHFRSEVVQVVQAELSNRALSDGREGFFHSSHFTFGKDVYISTLYAAIEGVEGVDSVTIAKFRRYGQRDNGELQKGVLPIGPWEIARLDNDPNFMENGVLRISALGGKG
ncbi:MAG TPA: putative baseplate assembly protein, partial [Polyangiaceae bacterium]